MSRTVYLNGAYLPAEQAKVSIFDRAVLFGDAVYEVAGVLDGKLLDFDSHMQRLERSLNALSIPTPLSRDQILEAYRHLVQVNEITEGMVYLQISRGVVDRDFVYPSGLTPTVFMFSQNYPSEHSEKSRTGVALKSIPDIRWARRDIKSVNLLGQVLAKQSASEAGAYEALLVDEEGFVTECASTSFYIVKNQTIITRPLSNDILPGVTRKALLSLCRDNSYSFSEQRVTLQEAYDADEAFVTGASTYVLAVTKIDGKQIGSGKPGPITNNLRQAYLEFARKTAI